MKYGTSLGQIFLMRAPEHYNHKKGKPTENGTHEQGPPQTDGICHLVTEGGSGRNPGSVCLPNVCNWPNDLPSFQNAY